MFFYDFKYSQIILGPDSERVNEHSKSLSNWIKNKILIYLLEVCIEMIKLYWLSVNILRKKEFFLLVLLSTYSPLELPLSVLLINIFFALPKHITFTSKVENPTAVHCYLLSSTSHHPCQNLNFSKLSYLLFSCSSRKKALCNHTLSTCLFPLTFEAIAPCKHSLSGTRDSKIIQPSRSFRKPWVKASFCE